MQRADPRVGQGWIAAFGEEREPPGAPFDTARDAAGYSAPRGRALALRSAPADWAPAVAHAGGCHVLFDGHLANRAELAARLADVLPPDATDAALAAHAYACWREEALPRLRGVFALALWDDARDVLLCARDPLGIHPLFYAEAGHTLLLSPTVESLLACPGVPRDLNRARLVDHLAWRWLALEETYFAGIRRVPPGHALRLAGSHRRVYRYWYPVSPDRAVDWVPDDEAQGRFDAVFTRAVERCLAAGPAAVYLSGGLDSASVALAATDLCRLSAQPAPWALSLGFPGGDCDESAVEREVAARLGMPQVLRPLGEAAGPRGILAAAIAASPTLAAPVQLFLYPAFARLALEARQAGCGVILTGDGGDDWLGVEHVLAADMLRALDLPGIYGLWRAHARSYPFGPWQPLRYLLWGFGGRPLVKRAACAAAMGLGARGLLQRRWHQSATRAASVPPWLAPDPSLRAQVVQRLEEHASQDTAVGPGDSFYARDITARLDHPRTCFRLEEAFARGRRTGVPERPPFWDPDLITLLARIRPHVRNRGGYSKAVVRDAVAQRLPGLGFDRQSKSNPVAYFLSLFAAEAGAAVQAAGPVWALGELGVVDPSQMGAFFEDPVAADGGRRGWGRVWELLNVEAWARAHFPAGPRGA